MLKALPKLLNKKPVTHIAVNNSSSSLYIFDRNVKRMQRNRIITDPNYQDYEYVKAEVGYRLADRVFDIKRTFNNVLDLGCQRGYVSKHLDKVILNIC